MEHMEHSLERVWNKINELSAEIGSVASRQRATDEIFRRQDIYCTNEIKRWDEMKTEIGGLNERLTRLEERMSAILSRLESMTTLPWKLVGAMAGAAAIMMAFFKVISSWIKSGAN